MKVSAPAPGTLVGGKYRVERPLAVGGMAVVVEATHVALGHRVAMKILTGDAASAPELLARFRREAQIAATLPGEHIARVTDVGTTQEGTPYLVMELLVGNDLERELETRGRLPVEEAVDLVLQACVGVAEAHAAGLVHRDLKPGNLFLAKRRDGSRVVKVLDFGISKAAPGSDARLTATQSNFGTPLYMSPEQVQSAKLVDARCDQHAIGAILYALVTGQPPYVAESLTAIAVKIATATPAPLAERAPDAPRELEDVIHRALAKLPERRYASLIELTEALAPFGGTDARRSVAAVRIALTTPPAAREPMNEELVDALPTTPAVSGASLQLMTSSPTTTSVTGDRRGRLPISVALGFTAGLLVVVIVVLLSLPRHGDEARSSAEASVTHESGAIAPVPASPPGSAIATASATTASATTASATTASATTASATTASAAPTIEPAGSSSTAGATSAPGKRAQPTKRGSSQSPRAVFDKP